MLSGAGATSTATTYLRARIVKGRAPSEPTDPAVAAKVNWEKKVFQDALKESSLDCLFSLGCRPGLEEGKGGEEKVEKRVKMSGRGGRGRM